MTENLQETEIKVGETGKMVYIGPNIQGLLSGTVFDYMPEIENYKEYESIEKLFVSLGSLKEETLKLREKSNYLHFIYENKRVQKEVSALKAGNIGAFLDDVKASGNSSFKYLQNVYSNQDIKNQNVSLALFVSEMFLGQNGVCRVHGGGFAGTIQAFVKNGYVENYKYEMDKIFGKDSCKDLRIRKYGGIKVL